MYLFLFSFHYLFCFYFLYSRRIIEDHRGSCFMSSSVQPMFSSKFYIVFCLTFRSSIHFEFIFVYGINYVQLFCNPMVYIQSMEFSSPQYCSGKPFPSPGDLPNPGIKPRSPALQAHSLPAGPPGEPKNTGVGSLFLLRGIFPPGIRLEPPALQVDSLPAELPGKP